MGFDNIHVDDNLLFLLRILRGRVERDSEYS